MADRHLLIPLDEPAQRDRRRHYDSPPPPSFLLLTGVDEFAAAWRAAGVASASSVEPGGSAVAGCPGGADGASESTPFVHGEVNTFGEQRPEPDASDASSDGGVS